MFIVILFAITVCDAKKMPDIYWNSTNQIFDISNTDHVMSVKLLDRVNIICPQPRATPKMPYEYTKLYAVSRDGYDNCELRNERLIGVCQNAETQSSISIVFRDFSPLPGALEFKPGHSYYIITTSDGSEAGIDKRSGGLCVTKHMKMKFEVHSDRGESSDDYVDHTSAHQRHHTQDHPELSTPLMYIIHTSESSSEHFSTTDDDGGATSSIPSTLTLMLSLLLCVVDGLG
uniref:Peptidase S1 domain-containing protein n=1 Tax=Parascaris univalens TaxID=6257 RepID=A0A915BTB5_PARUN